MFEGLTGRLGDIFTKLRAVARLNEEDVVAALREFVSRCWRLTVALPVVKDFIAKVRETRGRPGSPALDHARPTGYQDRP